MTKSLEISFNQGEMNACLVTFLGGLLEKKEVDGIMAPLQQPSGGVMQTLVTKSIMLKGLDPFAPVVPINSAKLASSLTASPSGKRIALVMRSCEIRAMVELAKLNQANFTDVLLIGIDCYGRFENADYKTFIKEGGDSEKFILAAASGTTSQSGSAISSACSICEFPVASADLNLGIIGASSGKIIIEAITEKGEATLLATGNPLIETPNSRSNVVKALVLQREQARDALFTKFREKTPDFKALEGLLADCVNCYNCRVACPVCYCKECVFVTDTFRHKGEQFMNWAAGSGCLKMPTDTMFYHLTRMSHIATICIGCGQCTSACPNDIDLMPIFRTAAEVAQKRFNYHAGQSLDAAQPLAVFEFDELLEVTGQIK